jgi:hypothetical protein
MPSDAPNPPYQTTRCVAAYAKQLLTALTRRASAVRVDVHGATVEGTADGIGFFQQIEHRRGIYDITEEDPVAHTASVADTDLCSFLDGAVLRILGPKTVPDAEPEPGPLPAEADDPKERRKQLGKKSAREVFQEGLDTADRRSRTFAR